MGKKVDKFLVRTENNPNQKDLWKMRKFSCKWHRDRSDLEPLE